MLTDAPAPRATIPQRLDRLPLTWTLWRLALVTQAGWALVIATDAIAARIYPFVWGPRHAFGTSAFSVLLLVSTGVGIVAGEYLFAMLADCFGRRRTLLAAGATCGLGTLPAGFVDDFWLLTLSLGIGAVGIGGVLATCTVYLAEVAPSQVRGRMTQTSQAFAVFLLAVLTTLPGIFLMPEHYQAYVAVMAAGPLLVLVPLAAFGLGVLVVCGALVANRTVIGTDVAVFRRINHWPGRLYPPMWTAQLSGVIGALPLVAATVALLRRLRLAAGAAGPGRSRWAGSQTVAETRSPLVLEGAGR